MFAKRSTLIMLSLIAVALVVLVVVQVLEMQHYELFGVLKERFF